MRYSVIHNHCHATTAAVRSVLRTSNFFSYIKIRSKAGMALPRSVMVYINIKIWVVMEFLIICN